MKKQILLLTVFIFLLNLMWEVSHSLLFDWDRFPLQNSVQFYIPRILYSTLGDLLLIMIMFLVISLKNRNIIWTKNPSKKDYFLILVFGFLLALFIEWRAKIQGRWFYTDYMPTIFGIGISPIPQLVVTAILSLLFIRLCKD